MNNKIIGEAVGTAFLVFIGLSVATMSGAGPIAIALAFGLALTAMSCVIKGCHLNPAVTIALAVTNKFPRTDVIGYVIAQVVGAIAGAYLVTMIGKGGGMADMMAGASNTIGTFDMQSVILAEVLITAMFVMVVMSCGGKDCAPLMIGLALAAGHLVLLHIDNASINPARSTATAVLAGGDILHQVWIFWVAPVVGGIVGGMLHKHIN